MFAGDSWGEVDTRFLYCAVNALSLLGYLHELDIEKTVGYIERCKNYDGGFGNVIGAESHAAQGKRQKNPVVEISDLELKYLCAWQHWRYLID